MKNSLTDWYVVSVKSPGYELELYGDYTTGHQGWTPCIEWCTKTFGDIRSPDSPARWRFISEGVFEFREEKDCTMFILRWL
jgi:hypothetical protein